jgi:hypothetical protein
MQNINDMLTAFQNSAHSLNDGAGGTSAIVNGIACGLLVIILSVPRGPVCNSYAGWDRYII